MSAPDIVSWLVVVVMMRLQSFVPAFVSSCGAAYPSGASWPPKYSFESGRRIFECDTMRSRRRPRMSSSVRHPRSACCSRKARSPPVSSLMMFGPDRVVEHRRGADLHGAAPQQEIVQRVRELRDAADPRERAIGEGLRHLRDLGERLRQDRRAAEPAARDEPVDVDLELQRGRIDQRNRRERVRRDDGVRAAEKRRARLGDDVGRRRRDLAPHRNLGDFLDHLRDDGDEPFVLADVRAHVLAIHVRARQVQLEGVRAGILARRRQRLPVPQLAIVAGARHDRRDEDAIRVGLLDPREPRQPPVERLVRDELPVPGRVQRRPRALLHRDLVRVGGGAEELGFRSGNVRDRVQADGLRDHAAPAGVEGTHDVAVGLGRRGRGQQERVLEPEPRERNRQVGSHAPSALWGDP